MCTRKAMSQCRKQTRLVIILQNAPSLVGKKQSVIPHSQDRAPACTRRTLSIRSNRGRRVLQVDDLHRTRERLSRSRYWSLASHLRAAGRSRYTYTTSHSRAAGRSRYTYITSHSRAARPLALLVARIALASGSAARVTDRATYENFFAMFFTRW